MMLTELERQEIIFSIGQAKRWLENHWKHLGPEYNLSYYKRKKEAEWHLDYALGIADRALKRKKERERNANR